LSIVIGVSGGSGSGKTSFVSALKEKLGDSVCFISFDNYYKPRELQQIDSNGVKNFDLPNSMDIESFLEDLALLKAGAIINKKEYTFNNANIEPEIITIQPKEVIIVEGLFIYHYPRLKEQFDTKIFIEAKDEIKIIRRIKRDQVERNYPLEDVLYRYEHHVIPSYKKYIEPYISDMDIVVCNNRSYDKGLEIVRVYISSLLT